MSVVVDARARHWCHREAIRRGFDTADKLFLERADFQTALSQVAREAELKLAPPVRRAILSAYPSAMTRRRSLGTGRVAPNRIWSCATRRTCLYERS